MFLFCSPSWCVFSLNIEFWIDMFFQHFKHVVSLPSGFHFSDKKPIIFCIDLYRAHSFSQTVFKILKFVFSSLIMMCLGMDFFEIMLFWVHWDFWTCKLIPFAKLRKLPVIISLNILSAIITKNVVAFPTTCIVLSVPVTLFPNKDVMSCLVPNYHIFLTHCFYKNKQTNKHSDPMTLKWFFCVNTYFVEINIALLSFFRFMSAL